MRFLQYAIGCVLLIWLLGAPVWAQGEVEVDWGKGIVKAASHGFARADLEGVRAKMMAQRAARVMALRDMAEFLRGVQITSETTVEDAMLASDMIGARVNSVIKQAHQVGKTQYDANGMATVTMAVQFDGNLADVVLPQDGFGTEMPPGALPATPADVLPADVTGLVIDARGLNLVSAMVPKIMTSDEQIVYGPGNVSRDAAVQNGGLAGYEKDLDAALKNDRVGSRPMVVKGVASRGTHRVDVIVSEEDARKVRKVAEGRTFLKLCRVVIVID